MSLNSILNSSASGLYAAQTQLRVISENITNVNTPGYTRRVADQQAIPFSEMGGGVEISGIHRVVDTYLQQAGLNAAADAGAAESLSSMLDRAQSLFGDPTGSDGYFSSLDDVFNNFTLASTDPTSNLSRQQALNSVTSFLSRSEGVAENIKSLTDEADSQITSKLKDVNNLLSQIDTLNTNITKASTSGQDPSGAQNTQSLLIDKLSSLMDVTLQSDANGRVLVRGSGGALLVGPGGAATLAFSSQGSAPGQITASIGGSGDTPVTPKSGELAGLLKLRNTELPGLGQELGEYVSQAVEELNRAHNASSSVPAPSTLTGRNTGLDLPTAVGGFTGKTTIAVTDAKGAIQKRVDVDFSAGTMTVDGGASTAFDSSSFLSSLNTALGGSAKASFSDGALSLSTGDNSTGIAIADDANSPSAKAGRGFSQFFGLNDLVTSTGFPDPATGLRPTDASGFTGQIDFRLSNAAGQPLKDVSVTVPEGGTMADLVNSLNSSSSGVGLYGSFSLDDDGRLAFKGNSTGAQLSVLSDKTERGAGGPSMSQLFGLDPQASAARASRFSVRNDIAGNSGAIAFAHLNLGAAAGATALSAQDNSGALALGNAGQTNTRFNAAGGSPPGNMSVSQYGAQLSGFIGQRAATAEDNQSSAEAVAKEAVSRRSSVEGVNLDQELVQLTTYQQSYAASARLISAVKDMYDVLLNII